MTSRQKTTLFLAGEVVGCSGLAAGSANCQWKLVTDGKAWKRKKGLDEGTSHNDEPAEGGMCIFQHPIDACYEAVGDISEHEWPRFEVEVRWRDVHGRSDLAGYGIVHMPSRPGVHELSAQLWRPQGSFSDRFTAFFLGGNPRLKDNALRYGLTDENEGGAPRLMRAVGRQRMTSQPSGVVHLTMNVTIRREIEGSDD